MGRSWLWRPGLERLTSRLERATSERMSMNVPFLLLHTQTHTQRERESEREEVIKRALDCYGKVNDFSYSVSKRIVFWCLPS